MELKYQKIPVEFLSALPEGIKFVNKRGRGYLIVDEIYCPQGHDLVADSVRIHGEPSIRIQLDTGLSRGLAFVDAFWGGHAKLYNFIPILSDEMPILSACCPECGANMVVERKCSIEGCDSAHSIVLSLPGQRNKIYVCARLGCPGHHIEIVQLPEELTGQVDQINYFGAQSDDVFQGI